MTLQHVLLSLDLLLKLLLGSVDSWPRIDPYKPGQVVFQGNGAHCMFSWSWNYKAPRDWKVQHTLCGSNAMDGPSSDWYSMILRRLVYADSSYWRVNRPLFQAKAQRWRNGVHPGRKCGDLDDYGGLASNTLVAKLLDIYKLAQDHGIPLSRTLLNVGAGDGIGIGDSRDPVWELSLRFELRAVYIEPQPQSFAALLENLREKRADSQIEALKHEVQPADIPRILQGSRILQDGDFIDVLKIDIDVNDCDVAEAVLHERRVRLLVLEVNPMPPPVRFAQHAMGVGMHIRPLHGCSLSYMVEVFGRYGLWLYRYDGQDALFIDSSLVHLITRLRGEMFPVDEFDCFSWPGLFLATLSAPIRELSHWFFNLPVAEQLRHTRKAAIEAFCSSVRKNLPLGSGAGPSCMNDTRFAGLVTRLSTDFALQDCRKPCSLLETGLHKRDPFHADFKHNATS